MCRLQTTHLFSWASVSCVFFCEIVQHVFFMVRFSLSLDSTRPSVLVFVCSAYRSTIVFFFCQSFVLAKAVHLNTMHRFADTVRLRGTSCFSLRRCRCASGNVLAFMQPCPPSSLSVVMVRTRDAPRNWELVREAALPQDSQTGTLHDCLEEACCE